VRFLSVFTACGPFRISRNVPQNNPTDSFTKELSHEFRNKIERPRAMRVIALTSNERPLIAKVFHRVHVD
jgi:hypothetical protein